MKGNELLCVCLLFLFITFIETQKYTICTTIKNLDACQQLNRSEDVRCLVKKNVLNCILAVENNSASVITVSAEEAALATSRTSNLVVLAQFVDANVKTIADFEIAILTTKQIAGGFNSIKQTVYCHPGVDNTQVSPFILNEFEHKALSENNINICANDSGVEEKLSLKEYYIRALNDFFGPSCRPGIWTITNSTLNAELKVKYPKLTQRCDINAYKENVNEPFLQSFNCLLSGGEVAVTTIRTIENYLANNPNGLGNYTLLCRDGSNVNVIEKCSWTKQPWPLLLGHRDQINTLPQELRMWFNQYLYNTTTITSNDQTLQLADKYVQNLREILFPNSFSLINVTDTTPNLETYIKGFRTIPTKETARLCKSSASFCTVSAEEENKCKWVQGAALNYDMQPVIDCTKSVSKEECLVAVQKETADVAVVDVNWLYNVDRKNLTIIAFGEDRDNLRRTILVVNDTIIRNLSDLGNKKGCFSEYGDLPWLAFADTLRKNNWNDIDYYGKTISNFLNASCMPGVEDSGHEPYPMGIDLVKVCDICEASHYSPTYHSCKPDNTNKYYDNAGALECLQYPGDFAVLTYSDNLLLPNGTSIMCKNGTLLPINASLDDNCALSVSLNEQIVARKSDSKNTDIIQLLLELDERFASQTHTPLRIFDSFGNIKNLMFKDTTVGIEAVGTSNNKNIRDVMEMFDNIPALKLNENQGDSGTRVKISPLLCFALMFWYFFN